VLTERGRELRDEVMRRISRPPEPLAALPEADAVALRDILARALA
jgi:hypothetical protein